MLRLSAPRPQAQLRSLVLRGHASDPLRARQQLERALATVDWSIAGLPSQALVFLRRLQVHADAEAEAMASTRIGSAAKPWSTRVVESLRAQCRAAIRPWREPGAAAVDAVWFEDEHELAACLVRDWLQGVVDQRWWWRGVLGGLPVESWLRVELLSRGERLAPTLQALASASLATAWLARMDDADADAGVEAVVRAYGLPRSDEARVEAGVAGPGAPTADSRGVAMPTRRGPATPPSPARRRLEAIVPELAVTGWRPSQARLLAYGLAVLRAPSTARSATFTADIAAWRPAMPCEPTDDASGLLPAVVDQAAVWHEAGSQTGQLVAMPHRQAAIEGRRAPVRSEAGDTRVATKHDDGLHAAPARMPEPPSPARVDDRPGQVVDPARRIEASTTASIVPARPDDAIETESPVVSSAGHAMVEAPSAGDDMATAPIAPARSRAIATTHGGLFYLLNAALTLGLYGDFTAPRAQGLSLSPWDLLAWLGQHWFGRAFRRDPLWRLLADLAGRAAKRAPSWRVDPPSRWAPDDDWLRPWAPMAMLEHDVDRRARRLQLRHPAGFAVFDVPRDTRLRPAAQARALCLSREAAMRARLRPSASRSSPALPVDPGLRWLHRFAEYMAARLMRALGTASPREAVALLCRHPAEVRCDASRVEIALSLAHLPLPVRIAGLDRDPGWLPAAGRDVRFHFS